VGSHPLNVRNPALVAVLVVLLAVAVAGAAGTQPAAPRRPWIGEACKQEFSTLCSDLPASSRREEVVECLKKHPEDLSPQCSEAISDRTKEQGQGMLPRHHGRRTGGGGSFGRDPSDESGY